MKIAHIADTHLRLRQYGNPKRGEDFMNSMLSAIKTAADEGCKYILAAGDILDSTSPGPIVCIQQLDAVNALLVQNGMLMLVTSGNHDKTYPSWCSRFTEESLKRECGIAVIDNTTYQIPDGPLVVGMPFMSDSDMRRMLQEDSIPSGDILMWHGAIAEFTGYVDEGAITMEELTSKRRWKLIAMGHLHIHSWNDMNGVTVAYPGSTECRDRSEDFDKKFIMYDWHDDKFTITSVPFKTRTKQKFDIDTEEELEQAIAQFKSDAVLYIDYNKSIPNAMLRIQTALGDANILRARPYTKDANKRATDLSRSCSVGDPVTFLSDNLHKLVPDLDKAERIRDISATLLSENIDAAKYLEDYINNRLDSITLV